MHTFLHAHRIEWWRLPQRARKLDRARQRLVLAEAPLGAVNRTSNPCRGPNITHPKSFSWLPLRKTGVFPRILARNHSPLAERSGETRPVPQPCRPRRTPSLEFSCSRPEFSSRVERSYRLKFLSCRPDRTVGSSSSRGMRGWCPKTTLNGRDFGPKIFSWLAVEKRAVLPRGVRRLRLPTNSLIHGRSQVHARIVGCASSPHWAELTAYLPNADISARSLRPFQLRRCFRLQPGLLTFPRL